MRSELLGYTSRPPLHPRRARVPTFRWEVYYTPSPWEDLAHRPESPASLPLPLSGFEVRDSYITVIWRPEAPPSPPLRLH